MDLDEKDRKILEVLEDNGRISYTELGEKIDVTDVAAKKRISKLDENGVIDNFTVNINYKKMGRPMHGYLLIKCSPETMNRIQDDFKNDKRILGIDKTIGEYDLVIESACKGLDELKRLSERDIGSLKGVQEIRTVIVTD